jgi:hypothetical protein
VILRRARNVRDFIITPSNMGGLNFMRFRKIVLGLDLIIQFLRHFRSLSFVSLHLSRKANYTCQKMHTFVRFVIGFAASDYLFELVETPELNHFKTLQWVCLICLISTSLFYLFL